MAGQKRQRVRAKRGPMTGSARLARVRADVPAIYGFDVPRKKNVDARHKAGHDE